MKPKPKELLHCLLCGTKTLHSNSRHHSGENLAQCAECGTFKPHSIKFYDRQTRKQNPSPRDIDAQKKRAGDLYRNFTGHEPGDEVMIDKPNIPGVMSVIGDVDGILYTTVRDGVTEKYIHKFKKNSRPLFCVSPDGLQLHLIGGSYEFGERGIIDK